MGWLCDGHTANEKTICRAAPQTTLHLETETIDRCGTSTIPSSSHDRYHYQAISAGHGVVSTSGCAGPVSQPLVTGTYQSVAHLDQVLSMLMCLVVVGLGASLSFGSFFPSSVVD